jgi:fructokinase
VIPTPHRALVIGESLIDIVHRPDGVVELPGGSPMNVAVGLARLGRPVALATWIGRDSRGRAIEQHLTAAGVRLASGSDGAERTSSALVRLNATGEAQYEFELSWDFVQQARREPAALVHSGSLATVIEPGAGKVAKFLRNTQIGSDAIVSFDPNLRQQFLADRATAVGCTENLVASSNLVKASEQDISNLYADRATADVALRWLSLGPSLVVVTRGPLGAMVFAPQIESDRPAVATTVVDTIGAGDSFMAALLDGLWAEGLLTSRQALKNATADQLARSVDWALRAAAITVSRSGACLPSAQEMDAA